ncbi:hypothetical protein [Helicobacter cetorum]|uniref:Uncharacterized protein n=1 Tax=Helicobacter cetorum (strain ATCC BAA-540 / CCUG 52418 / MIT 99-5656) TaxID=1163745 RepID=I0EUV0_HELCM|nr:hypothetical protein [Helicobacter cetorum]AFI06719.1 hypothetical protein HCD_08784 [Helicobacter cetorum MIT 99-5656]
MSDIAHLRELVDKMDIVSLRVENNFNNLDTLLNDTNTANKTLNGVIANAENKILQIQKTHENELKNMRETFQQELEKTKQELRDNAKKMGSLNEITRSELKKINTKSFMQGVGITLVFVVIFGLGLLKYYQGAISYNTVSEIVFSLQKYCNVNNRCNFDLSFHR